MVLSARSQAAEFRIETIASATRSSSGDPSAWATMRVHWSVGATNHIVEDECLTGQEVKDLASWLRALGSATMDSVLAFTEPSLHFVHLVAPDVVLVSLWLELLPEGERELPKVMVFSRSSLHLE